MALSVNPELGRMVRGDGVLAFSPFSDTPTIPLAAPVGMTKPKLVEELLDANTLSVPPPCLAMVSCADVPAFGCRFIPVRVTSVPTDPLLGLKSVIVGVFVEDKTVKPLASAATSAPVVSVTIRGPDAAVVPIVIFTFA